MLKKAINSWLDGYKKMFCYSGRSTRREFGFFLLIQLIVFFVIAFVASRVLGSGADFLAYIFLVVSFLTTLPYNIRRLHDANLSGWICLAYIGFAPIVVGASLVLPPTLGKNKYGENPRPFPE